jgi:hypothetical protein
MTTPIGPSDAAGLDPQARRQRILLAVLGGVFALVLVVFVVRPLLSGGGGGKKASSTTLPPAPIVPTTTTLPAPAPPPGQAETFDMFMMKNPFLPLIGPTTGPTGGTTGASTGATTGATSTSGTTTAGGSTSTGTSTGASGGAATEPRRAQRVALLDVFTSGGKTLAKVRVNDTVYTVAPGDRFADNYQLVSLEGQCGSFLLGDSRFRLCEGEEVLK